LGTPNAVKFIKETCAVFNRSGKISSEWKAFAPDPRGLVGGASLGIPSLSNVRWYHEHKVCDLIFSKITWDRLEAFISRGMTAFPGIDEDDNEFMVELKRSQSNLLARVKPGRRNEADYQRLRLELAVFLHYGRPLAKWCYFLEGDYPTLPFVSEAYREIEHSLSPSAFSFQFNISAFFNPPLLDTPLQHDVLSHIAAVTPNRFEQQDLQESVRAMLTTARRYLAEHQTPGCVGYRVSRRVPPPS
jgi:hypothetical protein